MDVEWREIKGFPGYEVSSTGLISSFRDFHGKITTTRRILTPQINKDGYYEVCLYTLAREKKTKRVHRLVAEAFLELEPTLVIDHIDSNKLNNNVENLRFVTPEENSHLAKQNGLYKTKPIKIVETGKIFNSIRECAESIDSHPSDISHVLAGRFDSWKGLHFEFVDNVRKTSFLYDYQFEAMNKMFTGCILNGGVGSGKSRTGLFYYFKENGGWIGDNEYTPMINPKDLYIITTAMKRDKLEWNGELANFLLSTDPEKNELYSNKVVIDSWNNIKKYVDIKDAFFIFDEDRICGNGAWVKAFLKLAKLNDWIVLSATSGDQWLDYIPIFIGNGFYKNRTEFMKEHVQFASYTKYPKIERYYNTKRLIRLRDKILIDMDFDRHTIPHHEDVWCTYNLGTYKDVMKRRWDIYKDEPIQQASVLCYILRRVVNEDESRQVKLLEIFEDHPKMIVFYNFDYELEILKGLYYGDKVEIAEWNGHRHEPIPSGSSWVYLVQYTAGCEGWNCVKTDTVVFYSQNYSYKVVTQASGRIDRLNSPFRDLYYYHFKSRSGIDLAISKALTEKKLFNERGFVKWD